MIDFMAIPANLDAFLAREDFFTEGDKAEKQQEFPAIGIQDLKDSFNAMMRKPDFQRTTAAWDPKRVMQFVKSFAEDDLIPGVIFWNSPTTGNILVVDGAHRISALLAWIHDDYGDGDISQKFQGYQQNQDQLSAAIQTRKLVNSKVGAFKEIWAGNEKLSQTVKKRRIPVQWVQGDAQTAEESFYRINLQSVALDKIEEKLIRGRRQPNAIATRSIVQNGEGHHYWKDFNEKDASDTVALAKENHTLLFSPPLKHPVTSAHLPIGGKAYAGTAMEVTLELVEFANHKPAVGSVGPVTADALRKTKNLLAVINGNDPGCLGLHPAVYFYSHATGRHQPSALMAVIKWLSELDDQQIMAFTVVRKEFEDFLIKNSTILGDTISRRGSRSRSVPTLIAYYTHVLAEVRQGKTEAQILESMAKHPKLAPFSVKLPDFNEYGANFSPEVKSYALITDALTSAPTCRICEARYHPDSVNLDHFTKKEHGGKGSPQNARPTHFYCNSSRDKLEPLIAQKKQRQSKSA